MIYYLRVSRILMLVDIKRTTALIMFIFQVLVKASREIDIILVLDILIGIEENTVHYICMGKYSTLYIYGGKKQYTIRV